MAQDVYSPGDKVVIKSIDWYNENKDANGYVRCANETFVSGMSKFCGQEMTILCKTDYSDEAYYLEEDRESYAWTAEMFE